MAVALHRFIDKRRKTPISLQARGELDCVTRSTPDCTRICPLSMAAMGGKLRNSPQYSLAVTLLTGGK